MLSQLYAIYDNREAANITDWVMENITGWKKIDRILNKHLFLLPEKIALLENYTAELLAAKPVQYVLQEAWFYGMKLFVNEQVLIPRPETEELVAWIITEMPAFRSQFPGEKKPGILDMGTGSGCIAIALQKNLTGIQVYACDLSAEALAVAKKNAGTYALSSSGEPPSADKAGTAHRQSSERHPMITTPISFINMDFTDRNNWEQLPPVDIIVSNPPYIPLNEKLPGITGLLDYRQDTALPIRQLTQILLRGESTLTEGERELIATVVSHGNECQFCSSAHSATANLLLGDTDISDKVKTDPGHAPVSDKMDLCHPLCTFRI